MRFRKAIFFATVRSKAFNDVTEYLVESTKFDLPSEFLQKWMQTSGETEISLSKLRRSMKSQKKALDIN